MRLAGNVIVVTGASRGIGRAVALECAAQGATLALTARDPDALDHLLASRVFRRGKVTGRYDATIDDLAAIEQALTTVWKGWNSEPRRSINLLAEDRRRKERGA